MPTDRWMLLVHDVARGWQFGRLEGVTTRDEAVKLARLRLAEEALRGDLQPDVAHVVALDDVSRLPLDLWAEEDRRAWEKRKERDERALYRRLHKKYGCDDGD